MALDQSSHKRHQKINRIGLAEFFVFCASSFVVTSCIKSSRDSQFDAFRTIEKGYFRYLLEKTVPLDNPAAETISIDDDTTTGAALLESARQNVGVCYWEASLKDDRSFPVSYRDLIQADGSPNEYARNFIINRGNLVTPNILSLADVLDAMRQANSNLKEKADSMSVVSEELNRTLWDRMTNLGLAYLGLKATKGPALQSLQKATLTALQGISFSKSYDTRPAVVVRVGSKNQTATMIDRIETSLRLSQLNSQLKTAGEPTLPEKGAGQILSFKTEDNRAQEIAIVVSTETLQEPAFFWRTSKENDLKIGRYKWARFQNQQDFLTKTQMSPEQLDTTLEKLRQVAENGLDALSPDMKVSTSTEGIRRFGSESVRNVLRTCHQSPIWEALCSTVLATSIGALQEKIARDRQTGIVNANVNFQKEVDAMLNDPDLKNQLSQLWPQLGRASEVSSDLFADLKNRLFLKSSQSNLGSCAVAFDGDNVAAEEVGKADAEEKTDQEEQPPQPKKDPQQPVALPEEVQDAGRKALNEIPETDVYFGKIPNP